MTTLLVARLAIAALVGLAVGLEREWSGHGTSGAEPRFGGVRTFLLLGSVGGIAGWLLAGAMSGSAAETATVWGAPLAGAALIGGAALLIVAAYWQASRPGGTAIDGTTEVAALLVLALSLLAGMGELAIAGGGAALTVLALAEKATIHAMVRRIDAVELRAAFRFAVLALVILPILPNASYGPLGGINPRTLWIVVLIFSGLNFAGWAARRAVGVSRGYGVTGALGGVISSTAVTLQFSRMSVREPTLARGLGVGVVAACTVLLPRVLLVSALLNHAVAIALLPYLLPPLATGLVIVAVWLVRTRGEGEGEQGSDDGASPLRLWFAIRMAIAFQLALMAIAFMRDAFGVAGVIGSAALLGLTDMDALTLSMNRLGSRTGEVQLAARAIAVGVATNSVLKLTASLVLGSPAFRRVASVGLGALLAASVLTLLVVR